MTAKELKIKLIFAIVLILIIGSSMYYMSYTELIDIGGKVVTIIIKPGIRSI